MVREANREFFLNIIASVSKLEHENLGLRNQIAELIVDKEKRDKQLEMISDNYETKLQRWKVSVTGYFL